MATPAPTPAPTPTNQKRKWGDNDQPTFTALPPLSKDSPVYAKYEDVLSSYTQEDYEVTYNKMLEMFKKNDPMFGLTQEIAVIDCFKNTFLWWTIDPYTGEVREPDRRMKRIGFRVNNGSSLTCVAVDIATDTVATGPIPMSKNWGSVSFLPPYGVLQSFVGIYGTPLMSGGAGVYKFPGGMGEKVNNVQTIIEATDAKTAVDNVKNISQATNSFSLSQSNEIPEWIFDDFTKWKAVFAVTANRCLRSATEIETLIIEGKTKEVKLHNDKAKLDSLFGKILKAQFKETSEEKKRCHVRSSVYSKFADGQTDTKKVQNTLDIFERVGGNPEHKDIIKALAETKVCYFTPFTIRKMKCTDRYSVTFPAVDYTWNPDDTKKPLLRNVIGYGATGFHTFCMSMSISSDLISYLLRHKETLIIKTGNVNSNNNIRTVTTSFPVPDEVMKTMNNNEEEEEVPRAKRHCTEFDDMEASQIQDYHHGDE